MISGRSTYFLAACLLLLGDHPLPAAVPNDSAGRSTVIGQPVSLQIQPETVTLIGPRARQQLLVTAQYADGTRRDLTAFASLTSDAETVAAVTADGFVLPRKDGTASLTVKAGGQSARVPVTVRDFSKPSPVSFRRDVMATLNVSACNMGAADG